MTENRIRKLVTFDRAEQIDLQWLVEHGFGRTRCDAVRKAVALTRRVVEASG